MAINSGFSHEKWWFSIAMLVYQRVINHKSFVLEQICGWYFEALSLHQKFHDVSTVVLQLISWHGSWVLDIQNPLAGKNSCCNSIVSRMVVSFRFISQNIRIQMYPNVSLNVRSVMISHSSIRWVRWPGAVLLSPYFVWWKMVKGWIHLPQPSQPAQPGSKNTTPPEIPAEQWIAKMPSAISFLSQPCPPEIFAMKFFAKGLRYQIVPDGSRWYQRLPNEVVRYANITRPSFISGHELNGSGRLKGCFRRS